MEPRKTRRRHDSVSRSSATIKKRGTISSILKPHKHSRILKSETSKELPTNCLSFRIEVSGNSYPFEFTREQLNAAYGKAFASVLAEVKSKEK